MSYRASLEVSGRRVVCATGDAQALRTITGLLAEGALVHVVAPEVATTVRDLADRGLLTWVPHAFAPADLMRAALVVAPAEDDSARSAAAEFGVPLLVVDRDSDTAASAAAGGDGPGRGEVILVGGGPGDPGLLTVAGLEALRQADVVVTDRLAPLAALEETRPGVEIIDVSKIPRGEFTPQEQINAILIEHAQAGRRVVRLKGGDSFVFGRGGEEWEACAAAGLPVRVIPGVSSAIAAPALAGIPLTHRTMTQGFAVVSGHLPPGDPGSTLDWSALARAGVTLVILMGVATLPAITEHLQAEGLSRETPAVTIADAGLPSQRTVRGQLADIAEQTRIAGIKPPAVTVIGEVAGFRVDRG
jgi:uroporphyrin-III C-methyltransferase